MKTRTQNWAHVRTMICLTNAYYGAPSLDPEVVDLYIADFSDLPIAQVIQTYRAWRTDKHNTRPPYPAQIRALIYPEQALDFRARAVAIVETIVKCVPRFGAYQGGRARALEIIGPVGARFINRSGGWQRLCESLCTENLGTWTAQARDCVEVQLKTQGMDLDKILGKNLAPAKPKIELLEAPKTAELEEKSDPPEGEEPQPD